MKTTAKKRKSLKFGLSIIIVPLVVVIIVGLTVISTLQLYTRLSASYKNMILRESRMYSSEVNGWLGVIIGKVQQLGDGLAVGEFTSDEAKLNYMKTSMTIDESLPYGVYSGDRDGNYWDASDWVPDEGYVPSERQWYIDGENSSTIVIGEPYVDSNTGDVIVSGSMFIKGTEVMGTDINLAGVTSMVSRYSILGEGSTFIIDEPSGTVIAYPDAEVVGTSAYESDSPMVKAAVYAMQHSNLENNNPDDLSNIIYVKVNGVENMFICNYVDNTKWVFISQAPSSVITGQVTSAISTGLIAGLIMLAIFTALVIFILDRKTRPISTMSKAIHSISQGDFTVKIAGSGNDEITTLSEELDAYVGSMRDTLMKMTEVSSELKSHADESMQTAGSLLEASDTQVESASNMQQTMDDILCSTQSIAESATNLAMTVSSLNEGGEKVKNRMNETVIHTNSGKAAIDEIDTRVVSLNDTMKSLEDSIRNVENATGQIVSITETISDIASQTNLLALNASIEAARAGEAGKGFAVVAVEISKLAAESTESVANISSIIDNINRLVEETVRKTHSSLEDMEYSVKSVRQTKDTFDRIYENVMSSNDILNEVVSQIANINDVASTLAAVTEEQSASTTVVQETVRYIADAADNIKGASVSSENVAGVLRDAADDMRTRLQQYRTN